MKEYYVYGIWVNAYLYTVGFDYTRVEHTQKGKRFWYEDSERLQEEIQRFKEDEWLQCFIRSYSLTKKANQNAVEPKEKI